VHPDLCVALGAGVLAARLAGHDIDRVLVDVSPYSFGPSYVGLLDGVPDEHCYHPIIPRNTPLPASRTDTYSTMFDNQEAWCV
jgi:molecular chaperone DnaK